MVFNSSISWQDGEKLSNKAGSISQEVRKSLLTAGGQKATKLLTACGSPAQ